MINELQFRTLSGLHCFPDMFETTPVYLTGREPWQTIRAGLEAYHAGHVDRLGLLQGMLGKYGWLHCEELMRVLENSEAVPRKRWVETQIKYLTEAIRLEFDRAGD